MTSAGVSGATIDVCADIEVLHGALVAASVNGHAAADAEFRPAARMQLQLRGIGSIDVERVGQALDLLVSVKFCKNDLDFDRCRLRFRLWLFVGFRLVLGKGEWR